MRPPPPPARTSINIIHCAETIKGGIATYLRELVPLQSQDIRNGNITILIPESQKEELPSISPRINIITFKDSQNRLLNAIRLAAAALRLHQPSSIYHLHSTFSGLISRPLLKILRRKTNIIYCAHGWAWDRSQANHKKIAIKFIERFLSNFCDRIICISNHDFIVACEARIPEKKLKTIQNGIAKSAIAVSTPFLPAEETTKLKVLFIGRFDHQKGADIYCEAMSQISDIAIGYLAGGGVLFDSKELRIPQNVYPTGWLSPRELAAVFEHVDLIVIPSRWEGFGLVAIEAMRAGLPVIATKVGGLTEIVEDQITGLLVPPEDSGAISAAIRSLNRYSLDEMGKAGKARFERLFTIERVHKDIFDMYSDITE